MSIELGKKDIFALMLIVAMADMIFCICFFDWQQNNASRDTKHRTVSLSEDCEIDTEKVDDFFYKITAISVKDSERSSERLLGDFSQNQNISFRNMICEQIIGEHYIEDDLFYDFAADGTFSGFFDSNEPEVKGYNYEIITHGGDAVLSIYNPDKTMVVTYEISITNTEQIILYYPASKYKIIL